jgi:lysophospholipid hydrolase
MAVSAAHAGNIHQSVMSPSGTGSSAIESFTSLQTTLNSAVSSAMALANGTAMDQMDAQRSWASTFGRMTLFLIKVVPGILFWIITFTTITLPTFLFTLFSTSLTVTMNATTL